jgi:hypothetical protein
VEILLWSIIGLAMFAFGGMGFFTGRYLPIRESRYLLCVQLLVGLSAAPGLIYFLGYCDRLQSMSGMAIFTGSWLVGTLAGRLFRL